MTSTLDKQHNVRIDKKIYNNFVHESNYKSDLVIAPANTSIIPVISDGHALTKDVGSSITFNTTTTPSLLYSNYIEIGATVHVVANNVKVKEDMNMTADCIRVVKTTNGVLHLISKNIRVFILNIRHYINDYKREINIKFTIHINTTSYSGLMYFCRSLLCKHR